MIKFHVPYEVVGKGNALKPIIRPGGSFGLAQPKHVTANALTLHGEFLKFRPEKPFDVPVWVSYCIVYPWRTVDRKKREKGKFGEMEPKETRYDLGQLTKQLDDVLQRCGFVRDDALIAEYRHVGKYWGDDHRVGVEVAIDAIGNFQTSPGPDQITAPSSRGEG